MNLEDTGAANHKTSINSFYMTVYNGSNCTTFIKRSH